MTVSIPMFPFVSAPEYTGVNLTYYLSFYKLNSIESTESIAFVEYFE